KHADIPNFDVRLGAKEYEKLAEDNRYTQICGFSKPCTDKIIKKEAKPGDLLFKHNKPNSDATHIAIYTGDGYIIDSSSDSYGIDKRTLPDSWLQYLTVYRFPYNKPSDKDCVFGEIEITPSTGVIPENTYNRIMQYDEIIKTVADKNKISEALIKAVIMQESEGKAEAVSDTGCKGIMQFCEDAAKQYGLEDPFDPEESIKKGAEYFRDLLKQFEKYAHKDAFAIASYNVGSGVVKEAIKNTGRDNPSWREVSYRITPQLIYDVYCDEGKKTGGHFCVQRTNCIDDRCASKVKEVRTYVDNVLNYIAAFGGGSFSTPSDYERIFTSDKIGYYFVNPSFTTQVDYDLGVYDGIAAWAEATYKNCSGTEEDLYLCVKNKTEEWNQNYEDMIEKTRGSIDSPFLFKFEEFYDDACDGLDADYYEFIETFELCLEFGNPTCYCDFPYNPDFYKIKVSDKSIVLYDKDGVKEYYDFTNKKKFNLYHKGELKDYFIITKAGVEYWVEYFKDGKSVKGNIRENFYFVRDGNKLDDFAPPSDYVDMKPCNLIGKQHKFRFCALTPQEIYAYDKGDGLKLKEV
nr:transglycosylase SLT domain-containing protein [Nanoarchaeota archaeon]